ncbi:hypothetical protein NPIL_296941 [Nephila pilipes]|uniref:Uncharacterized protein n=1 Tax=Nephila pilipes TaxID=299642 RepID=A0A8X6U5Z2_NEPPI|nr:hypothetical protein NPIL_296941 [Nephila pilipes]
MLDILFSSERKKILCTAHFIASLEVKTDPTADPFHRAMIYDFEPPSHVFPLDNMTKSRPVIDVTVKDYCRARSPYFTLPFRQDVTKWPHQNI